MKMTAKQAARKQFARKPEQGDAWNAYVEACDPGEGSQVSGLHLACIGAEHVWWEACDDIDVFARTELMHKNWREHRFGKGEWDAAMRRAVAGQKRQDAALAKLSELA